MTTSNRITTRAAGLAIAVTLAVAGAAHAQTAAPAEGAPSQAGNLPVSILPEPDPNAPKDQAPDTSIATVELAAPGIDRLGLVSTGKGGFAPDLWTGTDPGFLKQILTLFPARVNSPAARRLAQNLLLSPGAPPVATDAPAADAPADAAAAAPPSGETIDAAALLQARVQNLVAMGDWADTVALLELVPADQMTDALRRIHVDAELASDHLNAACAEGQAALRVSSEVYWQELQVFCQIATEQGTAAALGLDVLREQKADDPAFFWAVDLLQGGRKPAPASVTTLTPLLYAMIKKAGATLPPALAKLPDAGPASNAMSPAMMSMVARIPTAEEGLPGDKPIADPARRDRQRKAIEARIVLAEQAVAAGSLDAEVLRELYKGIDLKQDTDLPLLTKVAPEDIRGRALLFQSALTQTVPTARAEVITRAVELARLDGGEKGPDLAVVGRAYAAMLGEMEASAEMVWFAGTAARALLAAGETAKAKTWLDLLHSMSRNSLEAGVIADNLWPLERLLSPSEGEMPAGAIRTWAASVPEVVRASQRQLLYTLFIAVGESVSPSLFAQGLNDQADQADQEVANVRPAVWNGLTAAARGKRVGETAALSLIALGGDGPAKAAPATLQKVIESLMAVGRDADARALAVESALIHGL
ncbi:MAG: hypothetical protein K1X51_04820 [Rhodospirillaceae bacterium]|nr:hypothetical protein [Rhodospirillaceae bacterium]